MLIQYLLDSTYIVLEYTNTVNHTKGKKQCSQESNLYLGLRGELDLDKFRFKVVARSRQRRVAV
jgi:hypothetical protein